MSDIEYIKRAVELADWFEWDQWLNAKTDVLGNAGQIFLDALAAQLVRQVDALVFYRLIIEPTGVDIESEATGKRIAETRFGSRTDNTIKAIIDSGVLDE